MKGIKRLVNEEKTRFNSKLFIGMVLLNIILYIVFKKIGSLLWMDTIGTFVVGYYIGPLSAFGAGLLTYIILGFSSINTIKFFIINSVAGAIFASIKGTKKIELMGEAYLIAIASTILFSAIMFVDGAFSPQLVPIIFISQLFDKSATLFLSSFFMIKKKRVRKKKEVYIVAKTQ